MLSRLRARLARARRADSGFTLIELVISVSILGLVMTAITTAMLVALKTNSETESRLTESRDVQFASTWFGDDVASANTVTAGGTALCAVPAGSSVVVQFQNYDITTPPAAAPARTAPYGVTNPRMVTYALTAAGELHRLVCGNATAADNVVAHSLAPTAPTVTVSGTSATVTLTEKKSGETFTLRGNRRSS
jgi:prepilin-type N-terminal cleavage/methylation domain-containing protein